MGVPGITEKALEVTLAQSNAPPTSADRRHTAIMLDGQVDRDAQTDQRQRDDGGGEWRAADQRAHAIERAEDEFVAVVSSATLMRSSLSSHYWLICFWMSGIGAAWQTEAGSLFVDWQIAAVR